MACTLDFRCLDEGLGGPKNKRKRQQDDGEEDPQFSMDLDSEPPRKKPALHDNPPSFQGVIAGRVSGRRWKHPRTQRASSALVSHVGTTAEQRARDREIKRAFRERKEELKEEIRKNKREKRERREEREKRKKENVLRSGTKLQTITNPKTLQKISKSKDKKLLKVVPDHLVHRNRNTKQIPSPSS